jgi:hypothetical protein
MIRAKISSAMLASRARVASAMFMSVMRYGGCMPIKKK